LRFTPSPQGSPTGSVNFVNGSTTHLNPPTESVIRVATDLKLLADEEPRHISQNGFCPLWEPLLMKV